MKKTRNIINQEKRFLRLCSEPYKEMIRKERIMTRNDFNRIYYVLVTLDMMDYAIYFAMNIFPELLVQAAEQITIEDEINDLLYSKEDNLYAEMDKAEIWLLEFWEQMPLESQRKNYKEIWELQCSFK